MDQHHRTDEFLENLDTAIFAVKSQSSAEDKKSLLSIQSIVRMERPRYVYLEIGSYVGGTLAPHLLDPLCRHAYSVDKRPRSQLDQRATFFDYGPVSSNSMIAKLQNHLPAAAFLKLTIWDCDIAELSAGQVPLKVDLALIDGEHTNVAAFRDFMFTRRYLAESCVVVFHDANLVFDSLQNIECVLSHEGIKFAAYYLPDHVFVVLIGDFVDLAGQALARISLDRDKYLRQVQVALWKEVAQNAGRIQGEAIGHY